MKTIHKTNGKCDKCVFACIKLYYYNFVYIYLLSYNNNRQSCIIMTSILYKGTRFLFVCLFLKEQMIHSTLHIVSEPPIHKLWVELCHWVIWDDIWWYLIICTRHVWLYKIQLRNFKGFGAPFFQMSQK